MTSMSGLAFSNAGITASAMVTLLGSLLVRNVIWVLPDSPSLDPSEPALQADRESEPATRAATAREPRREVLNLMGKPPGNGPPGRSLAWGAESGRSRVAAIRRSFSTV